MSGENVSSVGQSLNGQQRPLGNNIMSGENVSSVRDSLNQLKFPSASPYKLHPGCEMVLPTAVSE